MAWFGSLEYDKLKKQFSGKRLDLTHISVSAENNNNLILGLGRSIQVEDFSNGRFACDVTFVVDLRLVGSEGKAIDYATELIKTNYDNVYISTINIAHKISSYSLLDCYSDTIIASGRIHVAIRFTTTGQKTITEPTAVTPIIPNEYDIEVEDYTGKIAEETDIEL